MENKEKTSKKQFCETAYEDLKRKNEELEKENKEVRKALEEQRKQVEMGNADKRELIQIHFRTLKKLTEVK